MKSEKEMYAGFGNRSDELEKSPSYLCSVSSLCALEIDLYVQGKEDDLTNVKDF
ncbi:TPA: hypothetical protein HA265_03090 [Candidatus Woesearchaeota archaeon]|nr:hypothetical protein [Candidatus Woesearchaeota archaeon]